ncbi:MAG TPA: copper resistance protein CopC [Solirubrobacteraceae bacterium]|nr:copper resistance protein CopC [Solirubrobacteraceae bacterium]
MIRRTVGLAAAVAVAAVLLPATACAHAYLIRTAPAASRVLDRPPATVALTFDEAVEPRLAIISVTDARGTRETRGPVRRAAADPDTLVVALRPGVAEGWYLVYWRAISGDGHPVQGAYTYAIGPNPGPAPQFVVPHLSASADTPQLLVTRWLMFLCVMTAIGLLALRLFIARPLGRAGPSRGLAALTRAAVIACLLALIAIPVYLNFAVAEDSLHSVFDLGALVPLYRATAFGRGYLDMEVCFELLTLAALVALWLDRPERPLRSVAELAAGAGVVAGSAAVLLVPPAVGHAGQTSPRGLSVLFDFLHLVSGSVWIGGLIGLLVLWTTVAAEQRVAALGVVVPRFSAVALGAVILLLISGTGSTVVHMPVLSALWETSYGVAILVKIGLLTAAVALASGNLLRTRPGLAAARQDPARAESAARLLRRLVSAETIVVGGAVFTAALLSSLAPPPPAFAQSGSALAHVGPGRVAATVTRNGYRLQVIIAPNRAAAPDSFALRVARRGAPVRGATVTLAFNHLQMEMPQQTYALREVRPGLYQRSAPALIMAGPWSLDFTVSPAAGRPVNALIVDQADG